VTATHATTSAYIDCFSGASGDMLLGALIDAGCPLDVIHEAVRQLNLPGVSVTAEKISKQGIAATHVVVNIGPEAPRKHRHLAHILKIIDAAGLDAVAAENAKRTFTRLAEAEAAVHGTTLEKVHFHEVGADDAIVDIVGACVALRTLNVDRITCSPVPTGSGAVRCEHGVMPVPAPATANLLKGVPLAATEEVGELTTPTGAALLTTLCERFGPMSGMSIRDIGYGAGTRDGQTRPNVLRVMLGEPQPEAAGGTTAESDEHADVVTLLEANLDDAPGQNVAHAAQLLLDAGALDVFLVPIMMKKGRPGQLITAICRTADAAALEAILFRETSTFGVRRHECSRSKLARTRESVPTSFGSIRVKVGRRGGEVLQVWPEYDDCAEAAGRSGASLREVQAAALEAWKLGARRA
jgi:hypothetical protein